VCEKKCEYFKTEFRKYKNNVKKTRQTIQQLIGKQFGNPQISSLQHENTTVTDSILIANTI